MAQSDVILVVDSEDPTRNQEVLDPAITNFTWTEQDNVILLDVDLPIECAHHVRSIPIPPPQVLEKGSTPRASESYIVRNVTKAGETEMNITEQALVKNFLNRLESVDRTDVVDKVHLDSRTLTVDISGVPVGNAHAVDGPEVIDVDSFFELDPIASAEFHSTALSTHNDESTQRFARSENLASRRSKSDNLKRKRRIVDSDDEEVSSEKKTKNTSGARYPRGDFKYVSIPSRNGAADEDSSDDDVDSLLDIDLVEDGDSHCVHLAMQFPAELKNSSTRPLPMNELALDIFSFTDPYGFNMVQLHRPREKDGIRAQGCICTAGVPGYEDTIKQFGECTFKVVNFYVDTYVIAPEPRIWITSNVTEPMDKKLDAVEIRTPALYPCPIYYRLVTPAPDYAEIWSRFVERCQIAVLVINWVLQNPHVTLEDMNGSLDAEEPNFAQWVQQQLGTDYLMKLMQQLGVTFDKLLKVAHRHQNFIYGMAEVRYKEENLNIGQCEFFQALIEENWTVRDNPGQQICLTPLVYQVIGTTLQRQLSHVKRLEMNLPTPAPTPHDRREDVIIPQWLSAIHDDLLADHREPMFAESSFVRAEGDVEYYDQVEYGGTVYRSGQDLLVWAGDTKFEKSSHAEAWVARCLGFFRRKDPTTLGRHEVEYGIRLVWYYFQVDTVMSGVYQDDGSGIGVKPDYREVFLTDHRDMYDVAIASILCEATIHDSLKECRAACKQRPKIAFSHFFCRSFHESATGAILDYRPSVRPVYACEIGIERETNWWQVERIASSGQGEALRVRDVVYRVGDVIALRPTGSSRTLETYSIITIAQSECSLRRFWKRKSLETSIEMDHEFLWSEEVETIATESLVNRIDSKVSMEYVPEDVEIPEHLQKHIGGTGRVFFFRKQLDVTSRKVRSFRQAEAEHMKQQYPSWLKETSTEDARPLNTFELFAGLGGSSLGLETSGVATSRWALDLNPKALESNRLNREKRPGEFNIINGDASACLKAAVRIYRARKKDSTVSNHKGYPLPGEADLFFAGPPCQGWSRLNRFEHTRRSWINKAQYWVTLSWVEFLRPRYVMIENVWNITTKKDSDNISVVAKIIYTLRHLGYQVKCLGLSSMQHGLAQNRVRFIVIGARHGEPMIDEPPTTHFNLSGKRRTVFNTADGERLRGVDTDTYAFFRGKCLADVIGHLKPIGDNGDIPDYSDPEHQATSNFKPTFLYLLKHIKGGESLGTAKIPRHLFSLTNISHPGNKVRFGRYKMSDIVLTLTTSADQAAFTGLHPTQHRGFSVREVALLQGFPSDHLSYGRATDKVKGYGNAVPPPLGFLLGVCVRRARREREKELAEGNECGLNRWAVQGDNDEDTEEDYGSDDSQSATNAERMMAFDGFKLRRQHCTFLGVYL
ncbi:hypothetical protein BC832DRAFT_594022 [Gaertneriomyces semiglobifer]|nr:hypothetical protein BC832DRAFT_594022 [Gaertneriomyces semiglobifer]